MTPLDRALSDVAILCERLTQAAQVARACNRWGSEEQKTRTALKAKEIAA